MKCFWKLEKEGAEHMSEVSRQYSYGFWGALWGSEIFGKAKKYLTHVYRSWEKLDMAHPYNVPDPDTCLWGLFTYTTNPAGNYMLKVNYRKTRTRCGICSKLTIKIPERRQWCRSGIFIVNFEHISQLVLVFLLLTLSR